MLPSWSFWQNFPLVHFSDINQNFTALQLQELLETAEMNTPANIYKNTKNLLSSLAPPNVPLTCVGGSNLPTERYYVYSSSKSVGK